MRIAILSLLLASAVVLGGQAPSHIVLAQGEQSLGSPSDIFAQSAVKHDSAERGEQSKEKAAPEGRLTSGTVVLGVVGVLVLVVGLTVGLAWLVSAAPDLWERFGAGRRGGRRSRSALPAAILALHSDARSKGKSGDSQKTRGAPRRAA
jgi:hypothetical protein